MYQITLINLKTGETFRSGTFWSFAKAAEYGDRLNDLIWNWKIEAVR